MSKKSAPPKYQLPGKQIKVGGQQLRVLEGSFQPPGRQDYQLLSEVKGLVAWMGRVHAEKGFVLDAFPIFTALEYGEELTAVRAGMVLLADISRDFTTENRVAAGNFTLGHIDDLEGHSQRTYGSLTTSYITQTFLGPKLGTENVRFLAKRLARILKVNYPAAAGIIQVDKHRILLEKPFKRLVNLEASARARSFYQLAVLLGQAYVDAVASLHAYDPQVLDRSQFFQVVESPESEDSRNQTQEGDRA